METSKRNKQYNVYLDGSLERMKETRTEAMAFVMDILNYLCQEPNECGVVLSIQTRGAQDKMVIEVVDFDALHRHIVENETGSKPDLDK